MNQNSNDNIDGLLVKYLLKEASEEEITTVTKWINASQENVRYYNEFVLIWQQSEVVKPTNAPAVEDAWIRLQSRIATASPVQVVRMRFSKLLSAAAIFAAIALTIVVVLLTRNDPTQPVLLASKNNTLTDTLPDGSIITLNKNSSLSYTAAFDDRERQVSLTGEAFFVVTPNKQKPFIINTPEAIVRVTGTSFNVNSSRATTTVIVETGSVVVANQQQSLTLKPKQKIIIGKRDSTAQIQPATNVLYNYYRTKEFICNNTPLFELTTKLSEAYNVNFSFANDRIKSLPLTVTFYNQPLENIMDVVCTTLGLSWTKTGNMILIK